MYRGARKGQSVTGFVPVLRCFPRSDSGSSALIFPIVKLRQAIFVEEHGCGQAAKVVAEGRIISSCCCHQCLLK